ALDVPRAHVVGHDWGAAVAWLVGSLLPDRVDRLVAISVGHPAARGRPTLDELQKGWYHLLVLFPRAEELLRQDDWYLMRVLLQNAADAERYLADLAEPGALTAGLNWYRANLPPERLVGPPPTLPPISAPTLGIWSSGDLYLAEEAMVRSGQVVKGPWRYERFEDATHWIPLDQPERLHVEDERGVRRDDTAGAALAVAELGRDDQAAFAADLHRRDALVPALDHAAGADRERERAAAVDRRIEPGAVLEPPGVVDDRGPIHRQ